MSLQRLEAGNILCNVGVVYGMVNKYNFKNIEKILYIGKSLFVMDFCAISKSSSVYGSKYKRMSLFMKFLISS